MLFRKNKICDEPTYEILNSESSFKLKEAYNTLCSNVIYLPISDKCKKIAVTSGTYGEGKSSVAANLSIALAQNLLDKRILLVDADMRTSRISDFMKEHIGSSDSTIGLSDYLSEKKDTPNIINTDIQNFDVMFSGSNTMNPAGLLCSERMKNFMVDCESKYDYVILDTPPINAVSDAVLLINCVNGYILSTKRKYSKVTTLEHAQETLKSVGAEIFGVVLTESK